MALTLYPTFTPSGYLQFATALVSVASTTFTGISATNLQSMPTGYALPTGSAPATVLIQNLGPEPCVVLLGTAAATTTGTASAGSTTLTVASATNVSAGQVVVGAGIAPGTVAQAVNGTTVTLSQPTTAALSSTAVNFLTAITWQTGIAARPNDQPLGLAYGSNTFIQALCLNPQSRSLLNIAVGI